MKCAIMQPTYFPWIGYFSLIDSVDKFVILDNVKLEKHSWQTRNRIKTSNGESFLTIPTHVPKGRLDTLINETLLATETNWRDKHLKGIYFAYLKSNYFKDIYKLIEKLIYFDIDNLSEYTTNIIREISCNIGVNTEFIISSRMDNIKGEKDERLVNICKLLKCNTYYSPQGSAVYIEKEVPGGAFPKNEIILKYQNYIHPIYSQLWGDFLPFMGIADLLFNYGFKKSLEIIRSGKKPEIDYNKFRIIHK